MPGAPLLAPDSRMVLACLPGTLCDHRAFGPLIAALEARGVSLRSVAVDTAAATTAAEVAALATRQLVLAPDEVLVIAGFSLGGMIATHLARTMSPKVTALLLLDMNGEADRPGNDVNRRAMLERARRNGLSRFIVEETWPAHVAAERLGDTALRDLVVAMAESVGIDGFARQTEIAISRPRSIDILEQLSLPTLVVCGAEDRITPVPLATDIAIATGGGLAIVPGAGHFAILERPEPIADSVLHWLMGADRPDRRPDAVASRGK